VISSHIAEFSIEAWIVMGGGVIGLIKLSYDFKNNNIKKSLNKPDETKKTL
jgi:hypothetical protein